MTEPTQTVETPTVGLPEGQTDVAAYQASLDPNFVAPTGPARPDNIPEQFWDSSKGQMNADAILKSYKDLQAELTKSRQAKPEPEAKPEGLEIKREEPKAEPETPEAKGDETFKAAFDTFAEKFSAGSLEDADYKAVTDLGIPKQYLDVYLQGIQAIEAQAMQSAAAVAGGADKLTAAQSWARESMTDADLEDYNFMVENGRTARAVEFLMSRYQAAGVTESDQWAEGRKIEPSGAGVSSGDLFRSQAEINAAIADPRYDDKGAAGDAYRAEVASKINRSINAKAV